MGGAERINRNRSANKVGHDAKKMKTCAIVAEKGKSQIGRAGEGAMSLGNDGHGVRCMVVRFGFFCSHTSQFNADSFKWSTAEVLHGARQYTQEQRDRVTM